MPYQMWFGTVDGIAAKLQMVPMPARGMTATQQSWAQTVLFENGGANVARSTGSHKVYEMDFAVQENLNVDVFADYASGQYGTGKIYFADPMIFDQNILPKQWATPMECQTGGFPYIGTPYGALATTVPAAGNPQNLPMLTQTFNVGSESFVVPTDPAQSVVIPIPPTHRLWWGFRGSVVGSGVLNMAAHRISDGVMVNFTQSAIAPTSTSLLNATPIPGATYDWARLYITRSTAGNSIVGGFNNSYTGTRTVPATSAVVTIPSYTVAATGLMITAFGAEVYSKYASTSASVPSQTSPFSGTRDVVTAPGTVGNRTVMAINLASGTTTPTPSVANTWDSVVAGTTSESGQSITLRGGSFVSSTTASSQAATSSLTISNVDRTNLLAGDVLVACLRNSSQNSNTDWVSPGWTRQGPAFVPNSATGRVMGIYTHVVEDPAKEPFTYTFTCGGSGRAVGAILQVRSVVLDPARVAITSATAQLWPTAVTPTLTGKHVSGKGNSGCRFDGDALPINYVLRGNGGRDVHLVGMSATLRETGAWENA